MKSFIFLYIILQACWLSIDAKHVQHRLDSIVSFSGSRKVSKVIFEYNDVGKRTIAKEYELEPNGNISLKRYNVYQYKDSILTTLVYEMLNNNKTLLSKQETICDNHGRIILFVIYSSKGDRMSKTKYEYDKELIKTKIKFKYVDEKWMMIKRDSFDYDETGRMTRWSLYTGNSEVARKTYDYNKSDRLYLTCLSSIKEDSWEPNITEVYSYNEKGQVSCIIVEREGTLTKNTYMYDYNGNLITSNIYDGCFGTSNSDILWRHSATRQFDYYNIYSDSIIGYDYVAQNEELNDGASYANKYAIHFERIMYFNGDILNNMITNEYYYSKK